MQYCQCCGSASGVAPRQSAPLPDGKRAVAFLCSLCLAAKHRLEACTLCPRFELRWQCTWRSHFAQAHPGVLEKLANDPFPELAPVESPIKSIGTWVYGVTDRGKTLL